MGMHSNMQNFVGRVMSVETPEDLAETLRLVCDRVGFQYFALSHHVDLVRFAGQAIRLTNYPDRWVDYYDANALGASDPVHRASHVTSVGFIWSHIPAMIQLTTRDQRILRLGREQGIGDGFTIPANVPGEALGSCSFASEPGRLIPYANLPVLQLIGAFAFEAARRLWSVRAVDPDRVPRLTDRQRDCVLWVARGKGDWETGRILGLSKQTVELHIRHACERYGVNKRTLLVIRTLFDGTLTFGDIFWR